MPSDTFPTLAEYRHPEVAERVKALRASDEYQDLMRRAQELLTDAEGVSDRGLAFRLLHDLLTGWVPDVSITRGRVIHALMYDHAYEEVAAMVGLSRQRIAEIHADWMDKTSTEAWPAAGRWSRISARRQADAS